MNCKNCGASLPAHSDICLYCASVNDRNLGTIDSTIIQGEETALICPRCDIALHRIKIATTEPFTVERCDQCHGLFFDVAELEHLVDITTREPADVINQRINNLVMERGTDRQWDTSYIKCPICRNFMNRKSYGARSGVIVDTCKSHGVWVDGGELAMILQWAEAGGKTHQERRQTEKAELERRVKALSAPILGEHALAQPAHGTGPLLSLIKALFDAA